MGGRSAVLGIAAVLALMVSVAALVLIVIIWADKDWVDSRVEESRWTTDAASPGPSGGSGGQSGGSSDMQQHQKTYVFAFMGRYMPMMYLNAEGRLVGLMVDLTMAVCADQQKQCSAMYLHDHELCWKMTDNIGIGLVAGYFSGCVGYFNTQPRDNVFSFTSDLLNTGHMSAYLMFKAGAGYTEIGNRTVGFVQSSVLDPACVRRSGGSLNEAQIKFVMTEQELKDMLDSGEVDFALPVQTPMSPYSNRTQYEQLDLPISCQLSGNAVMTTKSQRELHLWFNRGLHNIRQNGKYRQLCLAADQLYGGPASEHCF